MGAGDVYSYVVARWPHVVVAQQLLVAVGYPVAPGECPVKGAGAAGGEASLDRGASRCYLT